MGILAAWRGFFDGAKKSTHSTAPDIPIWLMMGPMHEAIQSIHELSRHAEAQTVILRDIDKTLDRMDQGQKYTHFVLEAILRDQALSVPPPSRDDRYRGR